MSPAVEPSSRIGAISRVGPLALLLGAALRLRLYLADRSLRRDESSLALNLLGRSVRRALRAARPRAGGADRLPAGREGGRRNPGRRRARPATGPPARLAGRPAAALGDRASSPRTEGGRPGPGDCGRRRAVGLLRVGAEAIQPRRGDRASHPTSLPCWRWPEAGSGRSSWAWSASSRSGSRIRPSSCSERSGYPGRGSIDSRRPARPATFDLAADLVPPPLRSDRGGELPRQRPRLPPAPAGQSPQLLGFWSAAFAPFPPRSVSDLRWYLSTFFDVFRDPVGLPASGLAALAFAAGLARFWRRDRRTCGLLIGPVLLTLVASALRKYPFSGR